MGAREDTLLQRIGGLVLEMGSGVPRSAIERDPKRVINRALRDLGYPGINDLGAPSLGRALRALEAER